MPVRFWQKKWREESWIQRLFSRILPDSTVDDSLRCYFRSLASESTGSSGVFHAPTSPSLESAQESTARTPDSGARWQEPFATFDPASCSLRMCQTSLDLGLTESSVTLPKSGSMWNGQLYERPMSERATSASDCSSSPTAMWPTPKASADHYGDQQNERGDDLQAAARQMWPTPQAFDAKDIQRSEEARQRALAKGGCANLREIACQPFPPSVTTTTPGAPSSSDAPTSRRVLNPQFVEWLQNFPISWTDIESTDCGPVEIRSWLYAQRQLLQSWLKEQGYRWGKQR